MGLLAIAIIVVMTAQDSSLVQKSFAQQNLTQMDSSSAPPPASPSSPDINDLESQLPSSMKPSDFGADDFGADDIVAANSWIETMNIADWLGPLAPVALSPFFGITCLSGLSLWGPAWMTDNALLGAAGPLQNPTLFGVFLVLTALTSAPRLTKVSKPFAQAVDQLETYSVIVILLVIKFMAGVSTSDESDAVPVAMIQLGVLSVTADTLLAIAMVINVIVINSVKFFFEFLIWLTPIPLLDAVFEACNKTLCAALMAVYAFSPTIATIINLVVLIVAAIIFRWSSRRLRFYRTMLLDPILAKLFPSYAKPNLSPSGKTGLLVFPRQSVGPLAAKSRWRLFIDEDARTLCGTGLWKVDPVQLAMDGGLCVQRGWVMNSVVGRLDNGSEVEFLFSRRFDGEFDELVRQGNFQYAERSKPKKSHMEVVGEFA